MAMQRWRTRNVQSSVAKKVKDALTSLGWFDPANAAWAENMPVTWEPDHDPQLLMVGGAAPKLNTVGLSVGDTLEDRVIEVGGGMQQFDIPLFFDIYGESRGVALNIADDVLGILIGEIGPTPHTRYVPLYDFSTTTPTLITDQACEVRLVEAAWPGGTMPEWRRSWRTVKGTATIYWVGEGND